MSADVLVAPRAIAVPAPEYLVSERCPRRESEADEQKRGPFGRPALTFLVLALPALWLGWLMYRFGVDTPWGDEWDSTRMLFEKMQTGTLRLADFFAFHNEHRTVFASLLTFALGKLTHWNVRAEMLVIWLLLCVCSLNLWRVAVATGWRNARERHRLLLGMNVLIFSPLQWENLLWGFQIAFLLPLACMTGCFWVALSLRRPFDFLATMALCFITTFSLASGFASWFLTAPLLLLWNGKTRARGERIWWLAWGLGGCASIYFYFQGFVRPVAHPSPMMALKQPVAAMQFALAYLGNPFAAGSAFENGNIAQIVGGALFLLLSGALTYLWFYRKDRTLLAQALPWLSLAMIAVLNGALTTLGRFGFGLNAAMQSRYVSFAVMLPIGLLFLGALIFRHWQGRSPNLVHRTRVTMVAVSLLTALVLLGVESTIHSFRFWEAFRRDRLTGKAVLQFVDVLDEPAAVVRYVHWSHWTLKAWADNLNRLGYLHPALIRSNRMREIAADAGGETAGAMDRFVRHANGEMSLSGWAILPSKNRPADSVVLTYDDPTGEPIIFARVDVLIPRPDVIEHLHDHAYAFSGWAKSWKPEAIPPEARRISAWAFDADEGRAFPLGSATM